MRFARISFADKVSEIRFQARDRAAVALGLIVVLVLSLLGAAAAGAFASTAKAARPHDAVRRAASAPRAEAGTTAVHGQRAVHASSPGGSRAPAPSLRAARTAARTGRLVTSCRTVGHIGDSTSVGMISPDSLPDPAQRLATRYAQVGVRHLWIDASGGRSIVEVMPNQVNGYNVARTWSGEGFRGCWVFALGTNDTANVAAGSNVSGMARIAEMMAVAHGEPVIWVNTRALLTSGPWSEANMRTWNEDLLRACAAYPNMRIFDWAGLDQPGWHIPDGIHYTPAGYAVRAQAIATALARAFPSSGRSPSCVVS